MPEENRKLPINYIKSPTFETKHVDGCYGGITADGNGIFMATFTERPVIPEFALHEVDSNGRMNPQAIETRSKKGLVREVQIGLRMNRATALKLTEWLQGKLAAMDDKALQEKDKDAIRS